MEKEEEEEYRRVGRKGGDLEMGRERWRRNEVREGREKEVEIECSAELSICLAKKQRALVVAAGWGWRRVHCRADLRHRERERTSERRGGRQQYYCYIQSGCVQVLCGGKSNLWED